MSYTAFENKQGEVMGRVEALCRHLTTQGHFTDSSPIALPDVEQLITDAYYWVLGELARNGYSVTVTAVQPLAVLSQIQSLDAATQVESCMPVTDSGEPNERWKGMAARRDRLVNDYLRGDALEQLGATRERNKSSYLELTGRSVARKDDVYTDSDVVRSRFPRGYGQRRDVPARSGSTTASGADPGA